MKNVQISQELFMQLLRFHLMEDVDCETEIKQELEKKLDKIEDRESAYKKYIAEKEEKIQKLRNDELEVQRYIYQSVEEDINEVEGFRKRLFEKSRDDKDFLRVYLGTGELESSNPVKYNKLEFIDMDDPISLLPQETAEKYRIIKEAPIVSDFYNSCGVGIIGSHADLVNMLRNITLDIAIRHFYNDVKFVYILDNDFLKEFAWVKWLKNVINKELDIRNIVCDEDSRNLVLESLYANLSAREASLADKKEFEGFEEQFVIFVTDAESISTHPISRYIKKSKELGFTFVFFAEHEEKLPLGCTEIIRVEKNGESG